MKKSRKALYFVFALIIIAIAGGIYLFYPPNTTAGKQAAYNAAVTDASSPKYARYPSIKTALELTSETPELMAAKTAAIKAAIKVLSLVPDKIAPVIQLIGSNPASTNLVVYPASDSLLNAYAAPGAVAFDNIDGDIGTKVVINALELAAIKTSVVGSYPLTYTSTDAAGNVAKMVRTVNVVARIKPASIPQFSTSLLIPWAMPKSVDPNPTANTDYYEIAMRQLDQQILPVGSPKTAVWGYGSTSKDVNAVFNAPSLTFEAMANKPVRVKWINDLVDANGNYLPHLLPNDQTIEAFPNPATNGVVPSAGTASPMNYVGPVPIITHLHGSHVKQESDGYPEAWYMPAKSAIPAGYATEGPYYSIYKKTAVSGTKWIEGAAIFDYSNDQRANTLWYHDHAIGFTRTNVYAGPAGFYMVRGGAEDIVKLANGTPAVLPGPAPLTKQAYVDSIATGSIYEIPIALQDRTFNTDGSLFYPGSRTEFDAPEGFKGPYLPTSDVPSIWNPEFFGDTIIVNGNTWPTTNVQPKKYRLRFLNGSQARTFILGLSDTTKTATTIPMWQIGTDGGFLAKPVNLNNKLTMMPAERADVIVDFSLAAVGDSIILTNKGPDSPFQGGVQGDGQTEGTYLPADPATTGKVMQFKVVVSDGTEDPSTSPALMVLPAVTPLVPTVAAPVRRLSLNEVESTIKAPGSSDSIGPIKALLGTAAKDAKTGMVTSTPLGFMDTVSENIKLNDTEVWEIYNYTADAHPIHLHLVAFQVVNRQDITINDAGGAILKSGSKAITPPLTESGYKDTVMTLPGQVTRIRAKFDLAGRYVWHCHILEHEENDMMRPMVIK